MRRVAPQPGGTILHDSGLQPMRGNWVRSQPMNKDTHPAAGQTILVVEDEPLVRMDISEALRHHGYRVLEAANGDDALKLLAEGKTIHLVFTDVRMPGRSDGFDVARRAEQKGLPVLVTSGHVYPHEVPQDMRPLVVKPYSHSQVLSLIERKLRKA
jgi:two-component system, response regulator PdtaR